MVRPIATAITWTLLLGAGVSAFAQPNFGTSALVTGVEILVGEPGAVYRPGTVYQFGKVDGAWIDTGHITAPDAERADRFGQSLAVEGNRLVVGALGPRDNAGAAYVFEREGGRWNHLVTLRADETTPEDRFGYSVAIAGGVVFVGAPAGRNAPGSVYAFRSDAEGAWSLEARITAGDREPGNEFGGALAATDRTLFAGAPGRRNAAGGVYVFEYDTGLWRESGVLESRILGEGDRLGGSLDLTDDRLVAGATHFSLRVGGALLYARSEESGRWEGEALLLPFAATSPHDFGSAVSISPSELWIGAPTADGFFGALYRYQRGSNGALQSAARVAIEGASRGSLLGSAVAVAGEVGAVGMAGDESGAGSVAVLERDASGAWQFTASLRGQADGLDPVTDGKVECQDGQAGVFACHQVDLLSFLPISSMGGGRGTRLSGMWGWTDPDTGREYALVGRTDGTAFVDVTDPERPLYVGELPLTEGARTSSWREIKTYGYHAYVVSDNAGPHGMQVFDLRHLREVADPPVTFEPTLIYDRINSAHNVVINEETGYAYTVGGSGGGETCGGGLHMIDVREPEQPTFVGCFADVGTGRAGTGYTHDAQCVIYRGPDDRFEGREICFGANETAISIADVTDKNDPVSLATARYPNVGYAHQGWLTEDQRYFFLNDELDELSGLVPETRTLIWDMSVLDDPQLVKEYMWGTTASDHNLYVRGDFMYQSNYSSGLRIHDVSDPENPREVGYFDTAPAHDGPGFNGTWSNYPFYDSGTIAVTSIGEGLFVVRKRPEIGL